MICVMFAKMFKFIFLVQMKLDFPDIKFKIDGYQSPFLRRDKDNRG